MKKMDFILASSSPRRIHMLKEQGYSFSVVKPQTNEACKVKDPVKNALAVSLRKAKCVALKNPNKLVVSADTIVVLNKTLLGKPLNKDHALKMLKSLNNKSHKVITAFHLVIYKDKKLKVIKAKAVTSKVFFGNFLDAEYKSYIRTKEPMDKAGAYAIQGIGAKFVSKVLGSYTNVVGLPLFELAKSLEKAGISPR
ncbi:MAG TPA: Maf family protein [bacterium]|nr:Maf family protein [bacterium]